MTYLGLCVFSNFFLFTQTYPKRCILAEGNSQPRIEELFEFSAVGLSLGDLAVVINGELARAQVDRTNHTLCCARRWRSPPRIDDSVWSPAINGGEELAARGGRTRHLCLSSNLYSYYCCWLDHFW
jgi:hypothetical protein